jgi:hypothetical protein
MLSDDRKIKFIMTAGLPRSGSSLIQNILAQNSSMFVSGTSITPSLVEATRNAWASGTIPFTIDRKEEEDRYKGAVRGVSFGQYAHHAKRIVADKSRGWPSLFELMSYAYGKAYLIICTRDIADVCASMEQVYRQNIAIYGRPTTGEAIPQNLSERVAYWCASTGMIGGAQDTLVNFVNRGLQNHAFWIKYNDVVRDPHGVVSRLYSYLEEPVPVLQPIENLVVEDDRMHGYRWLHTVREGGISNSKTVANEILGTDLANQLRQFEVQWPSS